LLKKILYEPLVHFLVLGGLLFLFYSFSEHSEEAEDSIVISKERVEKLTLDWEEKFFSTPTTEEKQKLIDKEIYEEVFYNEALKLGLDKNDIDIRGHVAKKMEFVTYDTYTLPLPNKKELKKFMLEHSNDYKEEDKVHFMQNMMGTDVTHFKKEYTLTAFEAENTFGRSFSKRLFSIPRAENKIYKIESEYGVHEVQILKRIIGKTKDFEAVKEKLKDDYLRVQKERKNREIYEALKAQYTITIEEK